jgi:hypothetical protein
VNRLVCLLALCFAAALAGCKEPAPDSPGLASELVRPGSDIVVKAVRTYATADNVAYSSDEYYIVTLNFTNRLGYALAPRIDHFVLEDAKNVRYLGVDSGNANLAGIENYDGVLKVGENHDYTVLARAARERWRRSWRSPSRAP